MASTDQYGNKIPQPRIGKKAASLMIRNRRTLNNNPRFCGMCGFSTRGQNHTSGSHHQESPKVIEEMKNEKSL